MSIPASECPRSLSAYEAWLETRGWTLRWQDDGSLKIIKSEQTFQVYDGSPTATACAAYETVLDYYATEART